jgi:hypothetical protein
MELCIILVPGLYTQIPLWENSGYDLLLVFPTSPYLATAADPDLAVKLLF